MINTDNFYQQFQEIVRGGLPPDILAKTIDVTNDNSNDGTMETDTVINGISYTTVMFDEWSSGYENTQQWNTNTNTQAWPRLSHSHRIDVYQIPSGCAIDVQEITQNNMFDNPEIVDSKWVRDWSQRSTIFTEDDILDVFSDGGNDYVIFAYPPEAEIDIKKNTIRRSNRANMSRVVKWVVKIDRVLVPKVNYLLTEV